MWTYHHFQAPTPSSRSVYIASSSCAPHNVGVCAYQRQRSRAEKWKLARGNSTSESAKDLQGDLKISVVDETDGKETNSIPLFVKTKEFCEYTLEVLSAENQKFMALAQTGQANVLFDLVL